MPTVTSTSQMLANTSIDYQCKNSEGIAAKHALSTDSFRIQINKILHKNLQLK